MNDDNGRNIKVTPGGIRLTIAWHYVFVALTGVLSVLGGNWFYNAPSRQEFNNRHQAVAQRFDDEDKNIEDLKQQATDANTKAERCEQRVELLEREIDRLLPPAKNHTYRLVPEGKVEMPGPNAGVIVSGPPPAPDEEKKQ